MLVADLVAAAMRLPESEARKDELRRRLGLVMGPQLPDQEASPSAREDARDVFDMRATIPVVSIVLVLIDPTATLVLLAAFYIATRHVIQRIEVHTNH